MFCNNVSSADARAVLVYFLSMPYLCEINKVKDIGVKARRKETTRKTKT
jgi:hypothetical protein